MSKTGQWMTQITGQGFSLHLSVWSLCWGWGGDHEAGEKEIQIRARMRNGQCLCGSAYKF